MSAVTIPDRILDATRLTPSSFLRWHIQRVRCRVCGARSGRRCHGIPRGEVHYDRRTRAGDLMRVRGCDICGAAFVVGFGSFLVSAPCDVGHPHWLCERCGAACALRIPALPCCPNRIAARVCLSLRTAPPGPHPFERGWPMILLSPGDVPFSVTSPQHLGERRAP